MSELPGASRLSKNAVSVQEWIVRLWNWDRPLVVAGAIVVRALEVEQKALLDLWEGWEAQAV
jgi:hypothetical protein